jgi:hypothetical protein
MRQIGFAFDPAAEVAGADADEAMRLNIPQRPYPAQRPAVLLGGLARKFVFFAHRVSLSRGNAAKTAWPRF